MSFLERNDKVRPEKWRGQEDRVCVVVTDDGRDFEHDGTWLSVYRPEHLPKHEQLHYIDTTVDELKRDRRLAGLGIQLVHGQRVLEELRYPEMRQVAVEDILPPEDD